MTEAFATHLALTKGVQMTGHIDGFCISYGGGVVEVFPSFVGAKKAKLIADEALVMLSDCLGRKG